MLRTLAFIFGFAFLAIGAAGFFPEITPEGKLIGVFSINFSHSLLTLFAGLIALFCATAGRTTSRIYFQYFGIIFALLTALGFYYVEQPILGVIASNMADTFLHLVIAIVFLFLGFGTRRRE